jgi:hypothetical protein
VGQVSNLRADFPIGVIRGLQTREQDAILPHTSCLSLGKIETGMLPRHPTTKNQPDLPDSAENGAGIRCSFCHKSEAVVRTIIASGFEGPSRAYICDECIRVCNSILQDLEEEPK